MNRTVLDIMQEYGEHRDEWKGEQIEELRL